MPNTMYSPEEITSILNDYFRGITHKQYIGARYVPIFGRKGEDSIEWDNSEPYEPLTIVLYQGNSFTSRQFVPAGVDINDELYWAETGNYNAQVEQYRQEVLRYAEEVRAIREMDSYFADIDEPVFGNWENTTYVYVKIPAQMPIKAAYHPSTSVLEHAEETHATFACNAGLGSNGIVIQDGIVKLENTNTYDYSEYLAFNDSGGMKAFPYTATSADILGEGYTNAAMAYYRLVENGAATDIEGLGLADTNLKYNPRTGLFVNSFGDKYIIVTNGRTSGDIGLTPQQFAALMISLGAVTGWNLDGGGSSSFVYQGTKMNRGYDDAAVIERPIKISLYVPKADSNGTLETVSDFVNTAANGAIKSIVGNALRKYPPVNEMDLDEMVWAGGYYTTNAVNAPVGVMGYLDVKSVSSAHGSPRMIQTWYPMYGRSVKQRHHSPGGWGDWYDISPLQQFDSNTVIPENDDLNNYTSPGKYSIPTNTRAKLVANTPSIEGGLLIVTGASREEFIWQFFIGITSNDTFIRRINIVDNIVEPWYTYASHQIIEDDYTVSTSGNINTHLLARDYTVVGVTSPDYICIPFVNSTGVILIKVLYLSSFTPVDTEMTIPVKLTLAKQKRPAGA